MRLTEGWGWIEHLPALGPRDALEAVLTVGWIGASLVYALKFLSPRFDALTRYGKLKTPGTTGTLTQGGGMTTFYALSVIALPVLCVVFDALDFYARGDGPSCAGATTAADDSFTQSGAAGPSAARRLGLFGACASPAGGDAHSWLGTATAEAFAVFLDAGVGRERRSIGAKVASAGFDSVRRGSWARSFCVSLTAPRLLLAAQVLRRLAECLLVHTFTARAMTDVNFVAGAGYYVLAAATAAAAPGAIDGAHASDWIVIAGFLIASARQLQVHVHLARIRARAKGSGGERYALPERRVFGVTACPHYLAEIVVYLCLAIAGGGVATNPAGWANLVFVVVNLSHNARETRAWYAATFGPHRAPRYALIPGVF